MTVPSQGNARRIWMHRDLGYLLVILLMALGLRLTGIDWDQGCHLHPDERFLSMVGDAISLPSSWGEYMDPAVSPMNPYNKGFDFFVYGTLPLSGTKFLATLLGWDGYHRLYLLGRGLAALADGGTLLLLFWACALAQRRFGLPNQLPLFAAFFYAVAVLPIQTAHFFTVDSFLTFFMFGAFTFAFRSSTTSPSIANTVLSGAFSGGALATKLPALLLFPLLAILLAWSFFKEHRWKALTGHGILFTLVAFLALRTGDPHMFAPGVLSLIPGTQFVENIQTLQYWSRPDVWFPPAFQWIGRTPVFFALENLVRWGVGIPFALFALGGLVRTFRNVWNPPTTGRPWPLLLTGAWALGFFFYQSVQFSKTMRYFLPLYPFLAALGADGFLALRRAMPPRWERLCAAVALGGVLLWPAAFLGIYGREHSRVTASRWIYHHIPSGSILTAESWDDALPLPLPRKNPATYTVVSLPVFDEESPTKWERMEAALASADWVILSSNRGYGSLSRLPERFPETTKFYRELFDGTRGFCMEKTFSSFPRLDLGFFALEFPDDRAEEAFSVYDHPTVILFRRLSPDQESL